MNIILKQNNIIGIEILSAFKETYVYQSYA